MPASEINNGNQNEKRIIFIRGTIPKVRKLINTLNFIKERTPTTNIKDCIK